MHFKEYIKKNMKFLVYKAWHSVSRLIMRATKQQDYVYSNTILPRIRQKTRPSVEAANTLCSVRVGKTISKAGQCVFQKLLSTYWFVPCIN